MGREVVKMVLEDEAWSWRRRSILHILLMQVYLSGKANRPYGQRKT